jgi:hypothetical protein
MTQRNTFTQRFCSGFRWAQLELQYPVAVPGSRLLPSDSAAIAQSGSPRGARTVDMLGGSPHQCASTVPFRSGTSFTRDRSAF